jgi:hemolysin activation/secretion protein
VFRDHSLSGLFALILVAGGVFGLNGPSVAQGVACIDVERVELRGVKLLNEAQLQQELRPELGCVGLEGLDRILQTVTLAYVDAGYIAARAYLPEQDIGDGELTVEVVEGRVAEIDIRINGTPSSSEAQMAFPGLIGRSLYIRDVEQGLDQINRLASFEATSELDAGGATGETILKIEAQRGRPFSFAVSADNRGATATGERTFGVNATFDNPLGLADRWTVSAKRSGEGHVVFDHDLPLSRSLTLSGSVPYGYWTFGFEYAWSDYSTLLPGTLNPLESSGDSRSLTLSVERVIHRDQLSKTSLALRLKRKDAVNELLGTVIDVNSRILDTAELELTHGRPVLGGNLDLAVAVRQGLGARDRDGSAVEGGGDPWFSLLDASATFTRPVALGKAKATWVASLRAQVTNDVLYGSEQFSLGGFSSVRGTRESVLLGNSGAELTNTLYLPLAVDMKPLTGVTLIAGFDVGHVSEAGTLSGATLGLRLDGARFSTDVTYSHILSHPDGVEVPDGLLTVSGVIQF